LNALEGSEQLSSDGSKQAVWETTIGMDAAIGIINYSSAVARREVL
jgi:hypothetical protein